MRNGLFVKHLLFLSAIVVGLYGCNGGATPTDDGSAALEANAWRLTEILVDPSPIQLPDTLPAPIIAKFEKGKVDGFGGCNGFSAQYTSTGDQLSVSGIRSTKMFCEATSAWETSFFQLLENSQTYTVSGETLEIDCGDMGALKFVPVKGM